MPSWATPRRMLPWDGDVERIFNAIDAAADVLNQADVAFTMSIDITWDDGKAEEASTEDARNRLRFAKAPTSIDAYLLGECRVSVGTLFDLEQIRISIKSTDFGLADRALHAAQVGAESSPTAPASAPTPTEHRGPQDVSTPAPAPASTPGVGTASGPPSAGLVGWMETHQGLIAMIGVSVAVVGIIVAVLLG